MWGFLCLSLTSCDQGTRLNFLFPSENMARPAIFQGRSHTSRCEGARSVWHFVSAPGHHLHIATGQT